MSERTTSHVCPDGADCNHGAEGQQAVWLTVPQVHLVGYIVAVPSGYQYAADALGVELAQPTTGTRGVALTELAARFADLGLDVVTFKYSKV